MGDFIVFFILIAIAHYLVIVKPIKERADRLLKIKERESK
jgi:hypothetical protein